jgi:hypothetical protein
MLKCCGFAQVLWHAQFSCGGQHKCWLALLVQDMPAIVTYWWWAAL